MKKMKWIWFCLLICSAGGSFAQTANRVKMLNLLLEESRSRLHMGPHLLQIKETKDIPSITILAHVEALPKYSLPKGNVVCRLEEYVQLHTPMKLNIGVGGQ